MGKRWDDISLCRKKLAKTGYHASQIDSIIKDIIGTTRLDNINEEQSSQIVETLEEYIRFASKCHEHIKNLEIIDLPK
jgi:hypothetical protein